MARFTRTTSMNETPLPPSGAQTVVVNSTHLSRLWTLTIISLCLNGLILLLILIGGIIHHHRMKEQHGSAGGRGGEGGRGGGCSFEKGGFRGGFHHHFGQWDRGGWGHREGGFGARGGWGGGGPGDGDKGFRGHEGGGFGPRGGWGGAPGDGNKGFGDAHGGMGMNSNAILNMLTQSLTLTDDQKAKIKPIVDQELAQIQKEKDDARQAILKQIDDGKAKIKPLLNADQQKQLDAMPSPGQKPDDKTATPDKANP
jgi:hypothetical protein